MFNNPVNREMSAKLGADLARLGREKCQNREVYLCQSLLRKDG